MELRFKKSIYSLIAIEKAAFVFTEKAYILLDENEKEYIVHIQMKDENGSLLSVKEFENEALAQLLRERIYERTKEIRELVIGRAVSSAVLLKDNPIHSTIDAEKNYDIDSILKDWFENATS